MGGSHQASLRRTSPRSEVFSSLYPPRGHLQSSPPRSGKPPRQFPMEGLCAPRPAQDHDLGCSRVHTSLPAPRSAFRSGPHPPLRLSGQPLPHPTLQLCRDLLAVRHTPAPAVSHNPADTKVQDRSSCPICKIGQLITIEVIHPERTLVPDTLLPLLDTFTLRVSTSRVALQAIAAFTSQLWAPCLVLPNLPPSLSLTAPLRTTPTVPFHPF